MPRAVNLLQERFGPRLLFVGLQGSHRRCEAREDSDIDILTVLDHVDLADLDAYRTLLRTLPEGDKAGGFTCGRRELLAWPAPELFQFAQDTTAYHGDLGTLLPDVTHGDTVAGARAGVAGLHHAATYLYLSGDPATRADELRSLYKHFFFSMQLVQYLRTGVYAHSKSELLDALSGHEAELLRLSMDPSHYERRKLSDPDALFRSLLDWTATVMVELAQQAGR